MVVNPIAPLLAPKQPEQASDRMSNQVVSGVEETTFHFGGPCISNFVFGFVGTFATGGPVSTTFNLLRSAGVNPNLLANLSKFVEQIPADTSVSLYPFCPGVMPCKAV
jgi:hypothetical protein